MILISHRGNINGKNPFEREWGISANELAEQEGVSPEAIHMRVRNFGTPWQRRKRPNLFEKVYGKTIPELCRELNLHPTTLQGRHYTFGSVYAEPERYRKVRNGFCEEILKKYDGIGLTGPINNNNRILTQSFVSRKHMEIFGFYFPEELINWGIDDWYNYVYQPNYFYPLKNHFCSNDGGAPRYDIDGDPEFMNDYQRNVYNLRKKA